MFAGKQANTPTLAAAERQPFVIFVWNSDIYRGTDRLIIHSVE